MMLQHGESAPKRNPTFCKICSSNIMITKSKLFPQTLIYSSFTSGLSEIIIFRKQLRILYCWTGKNNDCILQHKINA